MPRIPELQLKEIQRFVDHVKDRLGLKDWQIKVRDEWPGGNVTAKMNSATNTRTAAIWISDDFLSDEVDNRQRTQILIHEVLHCHFEPMTHFLDGFADNELGMKENMFCFAYMQHLELAIDTLAWALVEDGAYAFTLPKP